MRNNTMPTARFQLCQVSRNGKHYWEVFNTGNGEISEEYCEDYDRAERFIEHCEFYLDHPERRWVCSQVAWAAVKRFVRNYSGE